VPIWAMPNAQAARNTPRCKENSQPFGKNKKGLQCRTVGLAKLCLSDSIKSGTRTSCNSAFAP
jgi:hypothetical protein